MEIVKEYYLELLFFAFCFANLAGLGIPQPLLYFPIIILACTRLPVPCLAFMCVNFLKDVNHAFFFLNYHISGFAPLTVFVGLLMMGDFIRSNSRMLLFRGKQLWIIVAYLIISFVLAENYIHPSGKVVTLLTTSILSFLSFAYILCYRKECQFYMMAIYSTLLAIYLMQLNIDANHYAHLNSIADFGFYRREIGVDMYENLASSGITYATHYQFYGTMVCMCVALLFSTEKVENSKFVLLSLLSLFAIGYTGARQYLGIIGILLLIKVLLSKRSVIFKSVFIAVAIGIGSYIVYHSILSEYFFIVEEQGLFEGTGRSTTIERGFELFKEHPIWGVGFGGYNYYGDFKAYPHNMIVEILSELGVIGFLFIIWTFSMSRFSTRLLWHKGQSFMGVYIIIVFLFRAMVSLSLCHNIILISSFCALPFAIVQRKSNVGLVQE